MRGGPHLSLGVFLVRALVGALLVARGPGVRSVFSRPGPPGGGLLLGSTEDGSLQAAPVLASDVHVEIAGVVARSRLTQIFRNPTAQPLQAVYVFPLPAGAAVDGLSLAIGTRALRGRIVERVAGEEAGRQALAEGRQAAVLTREGPDLFTVAVGAIPPGEEVAVVLDLQQVVAVEGGRFTLRFPMLARSAPGLPEEETAALAAPRRRTATTGAAISGLVNPFDLHVDLYPGIRLGRIASPSHSIRVAEKAGPLYTVDLERAAPADRDFVLSWEPVAGVAAQAALYTQEQDGERYVLLLVIPPAGAPGISDIAVHWDDPAAETWPRAIPDLRPGTALLVAARLTPAASLAVISGRRGGKPWQVVLPLGSAAPGQAIDKLWARLQVEALSSGPRDERAAAEARRTITELGLRYGLVTDSTSLVAEDTVAAAAGVSPLRAWVPLAEPAEAGPASAVEQVGEPGGGGDILSLTGPARVARSLQTPAPAASGTGGSGGISGTNAVRARPAPSHAKLRRRLHPRHRRRHRLHRRRSAPRAGQGRGSSYRFGRGAEAARPSRVLVLFLGRRVPPRGRDPSPERPR